MLTNTELDRLMTVVPVGNVRKTMLTEVELEQHFARFTLPSAGRALVRKIREQGPVRNLQWRMEGVRTRYMSKKMQRPLLAESRTCEFPAIFLRDNTRTTLELWPQPHTFDTTVRGPKGGTSRLQHTPDLFLIDEEEGFVIEEWRERARLQKFAMERPHQNYVDEHGRWRDRVWEEYFAQYGFEYRLRCSDEHPRVLLANLEFLEDYTLESTPAVPPEECDRMRKVLGELHRVPLLSLVTEHHFKADHVYQMLLTGDAYVDLNERVLHKSEELIVYSSETVSRADAMLSSSRAIALPDSAFQLTVGAKFLFDGRRYEVALLGNTNVNARDLDSGAMSLIDLATIEELRKQNMVAPAGEQLLDNSTDRESLFDNNKLQEALHRLDLLADIEAAKEQRSERTLRRYKKRIAGLTHPQEQLEALMPRRGGNYGRKLPENAITLADELIRKFHNTEKSPPVAATYSKYVTRCAECDVKGMSRAQFYRYAKTHEDFKARKGRRAAYQNAPIPLTFNYQQPVHGVLPHQICYMDHTIMNVSLMNPAGEALGKPVITLALDGALTKARAFWLSYRPASAVSVLMCLRDYVRRNGRLPRMLVLDNGREFHSEALLTFCSLFKINIRWRRSSRPRDSAPVERMLGATEQEVISALDGNSLALKDPRNLSSTHHPDKHMVWTLPALHGALDYYLFDIYPNRKHSRFGMTPNEMEARLLLQYGGREHLLVRFDTLLKLLTAPHSSKPTRVIDRIRGVYVDGYFYWNDLLAQAKKGETAEVRVELWAARVVYVCFRGKWLIALARDGGALEGRHRPEFELEKREAARARRGDAQKDKTSIEVSKKRTLLWDPKNWDSRLRTQLTEMYYLCERLGMTEVMPEARNKQGSVLALPMPRGNSLELLHAEELAQLREEQLEDAPEVQLVPQSEPARLRPAELLSGEAAPSSDRLKPATPAKPATPVTPPTWELVEPESPFEFF